MKPGSLAARCTLPIAALLAGQPHLVFLIDAAAGLTEMAIKSSAMGNDYDPSLDEKMFGLTMAVDALKIPARYYSFDQAGVQVWGATKGGYSFRHDDPEALPVQPTVIPGGNEKK